MKGHCGRPTYRKMWVWIPSAATLKFWMHSYLTLFVKILLRRSENSFLMFQFKAKKMSGIFRCPIYLMLQLVYHPARQSQNVNQFPLIRNRGSSSLLITTLQCYQYLGCSVSRAQVNQKIFFKLAIPGLCFLYFRLFNTVDSKQMFKLNFADDWILTADLWYCKWPLYQLSHTTAPQKSVSSANSAK